MKMKGFTMLISTIIIGVVGAAVATSVLLLGSSATKTSSTLEQSQIAKNVATACAEVALQTVHDNFSYAGTANVTLTDGSCGYTVIVGSGENRTITILATAGTVKRKIQVLVTQLTGTILSTWQEVQ